MTEVIREAARERQFVKRVNPVCPLVIELPIAMGVRLLLSVAGSHTHMKRDDIRLHVRKVVGSAREVRLLAINGVLLQRSRQAIIRPWPP